LDRCFDRGEVRFVTPLQHAREKGIIVAGELKNKPKTKLRGRTARFTTRAGLAAGSMRRTHDLQTTIERANQEPGNKPASEYHIEQNIVRIRKGG